MENWWFSTKEWWPRICHFKVTSCIWYFSTRKKEMDKIYTFSMLLYLPLSFAWNPNYSYSLCRTSYHCFFPTSTFPKATSPHLVWSPRLNTKQGLNSHPESQNPHWIILLIPYPHLHSSTTTQSRRCHRRRLRVGSGVLVHGHGELHIYWNPMMPSSCPCLAFSIILILQVIASHCAMWTM